MRSVNVEAIPVLEPIYLKNMKNVFPFPHHMCTLNGFELDELRAEKKIIGYEIKKK